MDEKQSFRLFYQFVPRGFRLPELLSAYGLEVTDEHAKAWEKLHLIPSEAERKILPGLVTAAEVAAASWLLNRAKVDVGEIQIGRHYMSPCVEKGADAGKKLDFLFKLEGMLEQYAAALNWFFTVIKFMHGIPANGGAEVAMVELPGGGFAYTAEPAWQDGFSVEGVRHPQEFEPPEAEILG